MNTGIYKGALATYLRLLELKKRVDQIKAEEYELNKYASDIEHTQSTEHQDHFKR